MQTIEIEFQELPLLVSNGIEAGLVDGSAEIRFHDDGEWSVGAIYLEGFKDHKRTRLEVDTRGEIYLNILDALETGSLRDRITAKVWNELGENGVRFRSDRQEHSTLHSAAQGV
jgi:hypothetical protein